MTESGIDVVKSPIWFGSLDDGDLGHVGSRSAVAL